MKFGSPFYTHVHTNTCLIFYQQLPEITEDPASLSQRISEQWDTFQQHRILYFPAVPAPAILGSCKSRKACLNEQNPRIYWAHSETFAVRSSNVLELSLTQRNFHSDLIGFAMTSKLRTVLSSRLAQNVRQKGYGGERNLIPTAVRLGSRSPGVPSHPLVHSWHFMVLPPLLNTEETRIALIPHIESQKFSVYNPDRR